jgi:hypothetical protein
MKTSNSEKLIVAIDKNPVEEVRVRLTHYEGKDYVDIRTFHERASDGVMGFTRKGIAIPIALLPQLAEALALAEKTAKDDNIL